MLIAALALFVDAILGWLEHLTLAHKFKERRFRSIFWVLLALFIVMGGVISMKDRNPGEIKIASKPTSEGYILAEIVGQLIENTTPLKVTITHGIGGGTSNIQPALLKGEFDLYPEYTGTAWQIVLKNKAPYRETEFLQLQAQYKAKYHLDWKGMFGFDNTYSLGVRKDLAEKYHLKTFSDLAKIAPQLTFGAEYDFFEREDGFKSLSKAYHFTFKKTVDMDNGLKYQSLFDKKIDVMTVFTTDGQLSDPRIQVLKDDLGFYPNYMAGMVVREDTLKKYPALGVALSRLNGLIDEKTMAQLNKDVEIDKLNPREVAIDFLKAKHLWVKHHD